MKTFSLALAIVFTILFCSCNNKSYETSKLDTASLSSDISPQPGTISENFQDSVPVAVSGDADPSSAKLPTKSTSANPGGMTTLLQADWDKKIIKTADLTLSVPEFANANKSVHQLVRQWGAYVASEEQVQDAEKKQISMTIKVPVAQFEELMLALAATPGEVETRKIESEDVSNQLVDTKLRLESKKQVRLKYLEFMKAGKNIEEVLKVQNEIDQMQEQIEAAEGRIKYLSTQSALSTIHLTIYQPLSGKISDPENPGFVTRSFAAISTGAAVVGDVLIGLMQLWPLWLLSFIGYVMYRKSNRRSKVANTSTTTPKQEA